jgi:hypothetical protein
MKIRPDAAPVWNCEAVNRDKIRAIGTAKKKIPMKFSRLEL